MNLNKERNTTLDIVRALCIIWIVGIWHLQYYFPQIDGLNAIGTKITTCALSSFAFMSGLFLGKKNMTIKDFYIARLKRFYFLYLIACISMIYGGWIVSFKQLFFALTGLSCFILPQIKTLWFFSMMIILYFITPYITYKAHNRKIMIFIRATLFWIILFILSLITPIDNRILIYSPFYLIGLITPFEIINNYLRYKYMLLISTIILIFLSIFFIFSFKVIIGIIGIFFFLALSNCIEQLHFVPLNKFLTYTAYSSMTLYLFHRHIYKLMTFILPHSGIYLCIWFWPIMFVVALVCAYYVQLFYDKLISHYTSLYYKKKTLYKKT